MSYTCQTVRGTDTQNHQYVGQTLRTIQERFQGHFYSITSTKNNIDNPVGRHFRQLDHKGLMDIVPDHKGLMDIEIHVLDFIHQLQDPPLGWKL
jgi:hypothetical protein